jgi:hypothetical protein
MTDEFREKFPVQKLVSFIRDLIQQTKRSTKIRGKQKALNTVLTGMNEFIENELDIYEAKQTRKRAYTPKQTIEPLGFLPAWEGE